MHQISLASFALNRSCIFLIARFLFFEKNAKNGLEHPMRPSILYSVLRPSIRDLALLWWPFRWVLVFFLVGLEFFLGLVYVLKRATWLWNQTRLFCIVKGQCSYSHLSCSFLSLVFLLYARALSLLLWSRLFGRHLKTRQFHTLYLDGFLFLLFFLKAEPFVGLCEYVFFDTATQTTLLSCLCGRCKTLTYNILL